MNWRNLGLAAAAMGLLVVPVSAQSPQLPIPAANSTQLPPGISTRKTAVGEAYVDAKGRVLYGMDTGQLRVRARNPYLFCSGPCIETWEPVAAPAGTPATPAPANIGGGGGAAARLAASTGPDWTVAEGPNGPQLLYKRTHLVFVRKGDAPGSTKWDGEGMQQRDEPSFRLWNVLRYVPPMPKMVAPSNVSPVFVEGAYAMADTGGRLLYIQDKPRKCAACEKPVPFRAGVLNQGVGEWTVSRDGDFAQWLYRGKPVFVSEGALQLAALPAGATILRP